MISEERLRDIEESWGPARSGGFKTPAAHIAREQVLELVAEIKARDDQLKTILEDLKQAHAKERDMECIYINGRPSLKRKISIRDVLDYLESKGFKE